MVFVVGSIYAGTILFCVGATAWLLRAWTRRRYPHKSPSDLHYIVTGTALLLSAGSGVLVASLIVMVLAKEDKTGLLTPRLRNIEDSREDTAR